MEIVKFKCETCQDMNKSSLGMPGYEYKEYIFDSLTEAWKHLFFTYNHGSPTHNMIAFIDSDDNGDKE